MQNLSAPEAKKIINILSTTPTLDRLIAENEHGDKFVANKIKSFDQIKQLLEPMKELSDQNALSYSEESDGICIYLPYTEGEELEGYLSIHNPNVSTRIRLAMEYLMYLIEIEEFPTLLSVAAKIKTNLMVKNDALFVNLFLKEEKEQTLSDILASFFTPKMVKQNEALKITLEKLSHELMTDPREIFLAFQRISDSLLEEGEKPQLSAAKEKGIRIGKRLLRIVAVLLALFVLYEMVTALRTSTETKYEPVKTIGTVKMIE